MKWRYPLPLSWWGQTVKLSLCGEGDVEFPELAFQLSTCVRSGPRTVGQEERSPEARERLPGLGWASQDWTGLYFPAGTAAPLTPPALGAPGAGDSAPRLPASVPPAPTELVGSTAGHPAFRHERLGTSKPCAGGER